MIFLLNLELKWTLTILFLFFYRFLSMNPNLKALFIEFRGTLVTELNRSNGHPRIVMTAIENVVSSLDDPEILAGYVLELGRRHARLGFKPSKSHVRV